MNSHTTNAYPITKEVHETDPNVLKLYERLFQGVPGSGSGPVSQGVFLERKEL